MNLSQLDPRELDYIAGLTEEQVSAMDRTQLRSLIYGIKQCSLLAQQRIEELRDEMAIMEEFVQKVNTAEEAVQSVTSSVIDPGSKSNTGKTDTRKLTEDAARKPSD
jgi:hypothetical protein